MLLWITATAEGSRRLRSAVGVADVDAGQPVTLRVRVGGGVEALKARDPRDDKTLDLFGGDASHAGHLHPERRTDRRGRTETRWVSPGGPSAHQSDLFRGAPHARDAAILRAEFDRSDGAWLRGLGAAHQLLAAEYLHDVARQWPVKAPSTGNGRVLGPMAKEALTQHFAARGGYYGAGETPHAATILWEQKAEGLRVLRDRLSSVAAAAPAWAAGVMRTLTEASDEMTGDRRLYEEIERATDGETFGATEYAAASSGIRQALVRAERRERIERRRAENPLATAAAAAPVVTEALLGIDLPAEEKEGRVQVVGGERALGDLWRAIEDVGFEQVGFLDQSDGPPAVYRMRFRFPRTGLRALLTSRDPWSMHAVHDVAFTEGAPEEALKDAGGDARAPKLGYGQTGAAGERWITVHPHGDDSPGVPVLLRPDPQNPRVARVVGGAGGKLNYLKIHLRSPEEYRKRAAERRQRQRQQAAQRRAGGEAGAGQQESRSKAAQKLRERHREDEAALHAEMAKQLGWQDHEPGDDQVRGLDEDAAARVRREHAQRLRADARRAVKNARDLLVGSAEARAAAGLGTVPLAGGDDHLGAEDLIGADAIRRGLGYRPESAGLSDDELRAEKVRAIEGRMRAEVADGSAEEAALLARRLAAHRPIAAEEVADAAPQVLAGLAQVAVARLEATRDVLEDGGDEGRERALAELEDVAAQVGSTRDALALASTAEGEQKLREALGRAADLGLLDPGKVAEMERAREEARFAAVGAPKPDALSAEDVDRLTPEQLDLLAGEAASRARSSTSAPADLREEAEQVAPGGPKRKGGGGRGKREPGDLADGGRDPNDRRTIDLEDLIAMKARRDDLAEEALIARGMDPEAKREFLRRAVEAGVVGRGAVGEQQPSKPAPEVRDAVVADPAKAAKLLLLDRRLRELRRSTRRNLRALERGEEVPDVDYDSNAGAPPEKADRGGVVDLGIDEKTTAGLVRDIEDQVRTAKAQALLHQMDETGDDVARQGQLTPEEAHADVVRHLSFGASNALNEHAQTILGGPTLDRQTIDTLGAAGAAELLAWAVHRHRGDDVEAVRDAVGEYHQRQQSEVADEAMREAQEAYDAAHEIHQGMQGDGAQADLKEWSALNEQRLGHLDRARQTLGRALGHLEATAGLHLALARGPKKQIRAAMGTLPVESAAAQARAIGLHPEDFQVEHDGTNTWLRVQETGFGKLVRPPDAAADRAGRDIEAIKRGDHDEQGWLPRGFARRSAPAPYEGPAAETHAEPLDAGLERHGSMREALASYIGSRVNDGWSPEDIHADLLRDEHRQAIERATSGSGTPSEHPALAGWDRDNPEPERYAPSLFGGDEQTEAWTQWRRQRGEHAADLGPAPAAGDAAGARHGEFKAALDELLPSRHEGGEARQRSARYSERLKGIADEYNRSRRGGDTTGALHHQKLDDEHARDASFRALARHPAAVGAFKPASELTNDERTALREAFHRYQSRPEGEHVAHPDERIRDWETHNPEPERMAPSLFGGEEQTEAWTGWKRDRDAAHGRFAAEHGEAQAAAEPMSWSDYAFTHGGSDRAYAAVQDLVKGRFLQDFHGHYQELAGQPLKAGVTPIANFDRHLQALDPEWRDAVRSGRAKAQALEQKRTGAGGRFGAGEVRERAEKRLEDSAAAKERQVSAFEETAARARGPRAGAPDGHERVTLGDRAEAQVARHVADHAPLVDPRKPFAARTGIRMDGDKVSQQRAVKAWKRAGKLGLFLGAGSGKTNVSFGTFAELRAEGRAHRGVFAVPSAVQGQFGSEALAYLEPGSVRWWASPGASKDERHAAYRDPGKHMVVVTHQALRDDVTDMVADHLGAPREAVVSKLTGYDAEGNQVDDAWSREETDKHLREALERHGAHGLLDFVAVDEGHSALNRQGKRDSHLARVLDSLGRLAKHAGWMTGSPAKNDASEVYDWLAKVAHGHYHDGEGGIGRAEFLRRYGQDLGAARNALRRELGRHTFVGRVDPGTEPKQHLEYLAPSEGQADRLGQVERHYERARVARQRGEVDAEAVRSLHPEAFHGVPEHQHQEKARALSEPLALAGVRDRAISRATHLHAGSAKLDRLIDIADGYRQQGRPGVVFARHLDAVGRIRKALEERGHRVVSFTGADGADAKQRAAEAFQAGDADVAVLSDAGEAGVNLQRGSWVVHHDIPQTFKTWDQRTARINRLGQQYREPDVHTLALDHDHERAAWDRLERKRALHDALFDGAGEALDDTGLAPFIRDQLARRRQGTANAA